MLGDVLEPLRRNVVIHIIGSSHRLLKRPAAARRGIIRSRAAYSDLLPQPGGIRSTIRTRLTHIGLLYICNWPPLREAIHRSPDGSPIPGDRPGGGVCSVEIASDVNGGICRKGESFYGAPLAGPTAYMLFTVAFMPLFRPLGYLRRIRDMWIKSLPS